ncbi:hypothetical protein [Photorhabdus heterorhabditis]|uniref:hypothetical protein n=1 Tax=Photorhabdus heterorhabditis TaxID=880156 RepID=UPI0015626183|nr:hypothetical protein [Photorhabdus heterorhabditis]NRN29091.1 hypothetical protein [Photorhabdus heterorhabditis subsp. aluminescens]
MYLIIKLSLQVLLISLKEDNIPFILQVAALLAAFTYPSHRVIYALGDAFSCRRAAI